MLLVAAFLFMIGALVGWWIEVFYRNCIKKTRVKGVFVNPGFCYGPYLPIYGVGLAVMFIITYATELTVDTTVPGNKVWIFASIAIMMTVIELVGGIFMVKVLKMRLWDYRDEWGNFMGVICPKFSIIWAGIGALYYFLLHGLMIESLMWLSENLAFSFFIGLFFGIFIIDMGMSGFRALLVKEYGDNKQIVILYDELKRCIQEEKALNNEKRSWFNQMGNSSDLGSTIAKFENKVSHNKSE